MKTLTRNTHPAGIASIRIRFGLSQNQFAEALGISRSHVAMIETNRRSLPMDALKKLGELEIKFTRISTETAGMHTSELLEEDISLRKLPRTLAKQRSDFLRAQKLALRLEDMIQRYQKTKRWIRMVELNLEEEQGVAVDWWKKQEDQALNTLKNCNKSAQEYLLKQITQLDEEAARKIRIRIQLLQQE